VQTSGSFSDWPDSGYGVIKTSGGTEREIIYFSSRTATVLTVPAAGRGLLESSAAAGAATDTIDSVPGIGIGKEAPSSQPRGHFTDNTGSGEGTAPGGVSFSTPLTDTDAVDIGDLSTTYIYGLWIKREVPAGAVNEPNVLNDLVISFDAA